MGLVFTRRIQAVISFMLTEHEREGPDVLLYI